jgi:hypothetical protein
MAGNLSMKENFVDGAQADVSMARFPTACNELDPSGLGRGSYIITEMYRLQRIFGIPD